MNKINSVSDIKKFTSYYHRDDNFEYIEYWNVRRIIRNRYNNRNKWTEIADHAYYTDQSQIIGLALTLNQEVYELSREECSTILDTWNIGPSDYSVTSS